MLHDEESEPEPVRPAFVASLKGPENRRQRVRGYADAGVAHLDVQFRAKTARGNEHRATGRRVVNGIPYEVSQHAA